MFRSKYASLDKESVHSGINFDGDVELQTIENVELHVGSNNEDDCEDIKPRKLTTSGYISIVANSTSSLLGVSIFAMPWGFAKSGIVGGSLITVFVALLSFETTRVLLESQRILYFRTFEVKSFPEIATATLGPTSSTVVHISTAISCLGGCVGFLIFLGELSGQLLGISHVTAVTITVIPLILLSWIRSFEELTIFTIIGVCAIIGSICAISVDGYSFVDSSVLKETPLFLPDALTFLGPATFCYTIHYCVLAIGAEALTSSKNNHAILSSVTMQGDNLEYYEAETVSEDSHKVSENVFKVPVSVVKVDTLKHESVPDISGPLGISYLITCLLVIFLGASGFIFYRTSDVIRSYIFQTTSNDNSGIDGLPQPGCEERVCQNVILNLTNGPLKKVVGYSLCIAIVLGYVLILAPARENIEGSVLRMLHLQSNSSIIITRNIVRTLLVISTASIAILAPYFGEVLGTVGGLTDALQSFCLPPLICLNMGYKGHMKLSSYRKAFYVFVILWGIGTIGHTITILIKAIIGINV